jgi:CheY-like chemotaxis protein
VSISLPSEPVYIHADPVRLTQVFHNLINNACKYSEPNGRIHVIAERGADDVVVTVRDTGVGIPTHQLTHIFDMFTQLDRTLERPQSGLGIGLTLVKRLVEMHGGTVEARSEGLGHGSEFVVVLPLTVESSERRRASETASTARQPIPRRILIVDDNPDAAGSLTTLLRIAGNETQTAHDGLEAVAAAEQFRPEVVLLDIGLPKLNGFDAARRIREQPWGKHMALVALTGWGQEEDRRKSKDAGFDGHMVKPVGLESLMKLLASLPSES